MKKNSKLISKPILFGIIVAAFCSCLKDPDFEEYVPEDNNVYFKDTLLTAKDTTVPVLFGIDADDDGYADCQIVLLKQGDSIAYTSIQLAEGTSISIDTVLSKKTSPLFFARNYVAGDTIRKSDVFLNDTVMLAYKNNKDAILGTVDYKHNLGVKTVIVFKKETYNDIFYWWMELKLDDYSVLRLIRHSIPESKTLH